MTLADVLNLTALALTAATAIPAWVLLNNDRSEP